MYEGVSKYRYMFSISSISLNAMYRNATYLIQAGNTKKSKNVLLDTHEDCCVSKASFCG